MTTTTPAQRVAKDADQTVRYCPECGHIGPVDPAKGVCCPDSFGMSMRRWQAEKMERVLDAARGQRRASLPQPAVVEVSLPELPDDEPIGEDGRCNHCGQMWGGTL